LEGLVTIDPRLRKELICPACHGELKQNDAGDELGCLQCGRIYPVRDGIPVMLVEAASPPTRGDETS
jgi:uncharacterized protein YbaR (Trm112 family)